jgi:hypothetical protein
MIYSTQEVMKNLVKTTLLVAGICSAGIVSGQQNSYNDRYEYDQRRSDRRDYDRRNTEEPRYDYRYEERRSDSRRPDRQYDERDLSRAYDEGFEDGQRGQNARRDQDNNEMQENRRHYKYFTFGIYGGANSTSFQGETIDSQNLTGRLGYQLGFFVRGGGRIYGQVGAEYLTSSSNFYKPGDGTSVKDITSNIDQRYLHIPAYIGIKLAQSERGVSAVRLAIGAEYATPLSTDKNDFNLNNADFQAATINGLASLGFDAGPIMLGFVYHYGFADVLSSGNSKRRILGVNFGFKF